MENETKHIEKTKISPKKQLSVILNPLKTGEHSKYFKNPKVVTFLKDPKLLGECMLEAIEHLKEENLSIKEQIVYLNVLTNVYKALFGNKVQLETTETTADIVMDRLRKAKMSGI